MATYGLIAILVFAVSFVFSMLGMGGSMLYVPILHWLGFPLKTVAIPLGLLLNGLTTSSAFVRYKRENLVDFRGGLPAAASGLVMAPIGAWCVPYVPQQTLILLFALAVIVAGFRSLMGVGKDVSKVQLSPRGRLLIGTTVGGGAGFTGGLLGIGGGFIIAPMLMEIGYPPKVASATTAFIVTLASFSGFLGHMAEAHIDPILIGVAVGALIIGSQLGAWFMVAKAKPVWLKRVYGVVLLGVAAKLVHGIMGG